MVKNETKYLQWLNDNGVGKRDNIASSPKSYISYLNTVSQIIGEDISEKNLYNENCISFLEEKMKGARSAKSISNYKSAMRQYVKMVQK
ncbi:hypothetical protein [Autumnicola musiva]|uniref:Core-binding (CB) domain-containing protein n=1 Tax=Autumnicola musiva TaxID=3075589 RepID=A0ABU3D0R1_9FLAO|nr:hypothetical protein [Zunongwangia sp. F117]MDT0675117.1 hypothetical protein [Zunongwangia sp. F117]